MQITRDSEYHHSDGGDKRERGPQSRRVAPSRARVYVVDVFVIVIHLTLWLGGLRVAFTAASG